MLGCRILGQTLTESFTALLIPTYFLFMLVTLFGALCRHLCPPSPVTVSSEALPLRHAAVRARVRPARTLPPATSSRPCELHFTIDRYDPCAQPTDKTEHKDT